MKDKRTGALVLAGIIAAALGFAALAYFGIGRQHKLGAQNIKQGLDLQGGVSIVYEAEKENPTSDEMAAVETMLRNRLDRRGWTEAELARQGNRRVRIEIPGVADAEQAIKEIGSTAHLTFRDGDGNILVDGSEVTNAYKSNQSGSGGGVEWVVALEFTSKGATDFGNATSANIGKPLYIYLDEDIISSPNVQNAILDGRAVITGNFTPDSADELGALIKAGSLPFNLTRIESSFVGAKLGVNSLGSSLLAGLIGVCLVLIFMICVYRVAGFMADIALLFYTGLALVLLSAMEVTLTLPGIAGIVLSIGMAVDANIIIFERLKEEIRAKKTLRVAIDNAFKRAFSAIFDSNITTLIAAGVLFWLGTGPVKGFAQTLALGIVVSMFTAIVVTRYLLKSLIALGFNNAAIFIIGVKPEDEEAVKPKKVYPFVERRNVYFLISACIMVAGIVFGSVNAGKGDGAFNLDVEFTGGIALVIDVGEDFENADIAAVITEVTGQTAPQIQRVTGTETVNVKIKELEEGQHEALIAALQEKYLMLTEDSSDTVSATVSGEMQRTAIIAVLVACAAMLVYITFRFRDLALGGASILAILHDALIMLVGYALMRTPINYAFIAALLTVLGYSINSNIVLFDRLRENKRLLPNAGAIELMNLSVRQTITRSIYTTLTTLFTIVMIVILGVPAIREFSIPIIVGLLSGMYSSIFIAGGIWYLLSVKFKKKKA